MVNALQSVTRTAGTAALIAICLGCAGDRPQESSTVESRTEDLSSRTCGTGQMTGAWQSDEYGGCGGPSGACAWANYYAESDCIGGTGYECCSKSFQEIPTPGTQPPGCYCMVSYTACTQTYCGDGTCDVLEYEDCGSCAQDCGTCAPAVCGNGTCDEGEDSGSCCVDCGGGCGA